MAKKIRSSRRSLTAAWMAGMLLGAFPLAGWAGPMEAGDALAGSGPAHPHISENARRHFVRARSLSKDAVSVGDYQAAAAEYRLASEEAPRWGLALFGLGQAEEQAGDLAAAETAWQRYLGLRLSPSEASLGQEHFNRVESRLGKPQARTRPSGAPVLEGGLAGGFQAPPWGKSSPTGGGSNPDVEAMNAALRAKALAPPGGLESKDQVIQLPPLGAHVKGYNLYYGTSGSQAFLKANQALITDSTYTFQDPLSIKHAKYVFRLGAVDPKGKESPLFELP
jgi:hypothetical protein